MDIILLWIKQNWIECVGSVLGMVYVFLSLKQKLLTWPIGLLCSLFYIYIYFDSKFYADMSLQFYYVAVGIYGWYYWLKGGKENSESKKLKVSYMPRKYWVWIVLVSIVLFFMIYYVLKNYTDSPYPVGDSITTSLSIVATWMLARKYIENWIFWVFIDAFSAYLYTLKDLWATIILFVVYTIVAIFGYYEWNLEYKNAKK